MCLTFLSPSFKELPGFFSGLADWEKGEPQKQTTKEDWAKYGRVNGKRRGALQVFHESQKMSEWSAYHHKTFDDCTSGHRIIPTAHKRTL